MGMDPFLPTLLGIFTAIPLGLIPAFIAKNKGSKKGADGGLYEITFNYYSFF